MSYTYERLIALRLQAGAPGADGAYSPAAASTWRRGGRG